MSWNYRVMRSENVSPEDTSDTLYTIHEVHYDKDGAVNGWTEEPATACSEDRDGLLAVLAMMAEAIGQPVLDAKDGSVVEPKKVLSDNLVKWLKRAGDLDDINAEIEPA